MSVLIIAEAGVNHNGDLSLAKKLVDMALRCGADAVKFQTFKAEDCVNQQEDKVGYQKVNDKKEETQYEMLKKLELSYDDFRELQGYCNEQKIMFLSTPFGDEALEFLMSLDVPIIKLSSTEVTNHPYLKKVAKCNKPIILSTGMSYLEEVEEALRVCFKEGNRQITLLHCTTNYPTSLDEVNIQALQTMKKAFGVEVGYSDHTVDEISAIAAVTLGAKVIEKHITLDKSMQGPDHKASMEENEFAAYVKAIRKAELIQGNGSKEPTEIEKTMRRKVRRSIVAKNFIPQGTCITEELLTFKRPAAGLSPQYMDKLLGKIVKRDLMADEMILLDDVKVED